MKRIVFATSNQDKLKETEKILKTGLKALNNFEIDEIQSKSS